MLKIGTLFSGIGAFEWALKRMNIAHEILFACDNGNINLKYDQDAILQEIKQLKSIQEKKEFAENFYKQNSRKTNFVKMAYTQNYKIKDDNFFLDIKMLDGHDFRGKIDILVGGNPCQSFSMIGKKAGLEDTRGTLFWTIKKVIKKHFPKIIVLENVKNLLNHDKSRTFLRIQNELEDMGYKVNYEVLNTADLAFRNEEIVCL